MDKYIYELEVDNFVEKEVKKKKTVKGEEVTVLETESANHPTRVLFKKPNRRETEEAEDIYSIELSKSIQKGILTKSMLAKKYKEAGGVLSEEESKNQKKLYSELYSIQESMVKCETEIEKASKKDTPRLKKELSSLLERISKIRKEIEDIDKPYQDLFSNTAETRSQNLATKWYLVNCFYKQEHTDSDPVPMFSGETFDEKCDSLYLLAEEENYILEECLSMMMLASSIWFFTREEDIAGYVDSVSE